MFKFLKKKEAAPDIGQEEVFDKKNLKKKKPESEENDEDNENNENDKNEDLKENESDKEQKIKKKSKNSNNSNITEDFELSKINAKIESLSSLIKGYNERFSNVSQQIGELRAMNLNNEKSISKATQEALKTVDIVREVKPEKLRIDYQRIDAKISALDEKIEANKQYQETIMNELKDLRNKAGIFVGTDALLGLNEDVKKDLIEIQKISSRIRVNADKSEQIFIELKKEFAETQKLNSLMQSLDANYSGAKKEIEKLKLDYSNIINHADFNDFKKAVNNKIAIIESSLGESEGLKEEAERISQIVETTLSIARKNKEDIADIAMTIGDEHIKRVSDYESQLSSILRILDTLAGEITEIKKKCGMSKEKIFIEHKKEFKPFTKSKINMKNVDFHSKISESLIPKKAQIPGAIQKVQDREMEKEKLLKKGEDKI